MSRFRPRILTNEGLLYNKNRSETNDVVFLSSPNEREEFDVMAAAFFLHIITMIDIFCCVMMMGREHVLRAASFPSPNP